jgi:DNA-binding PadR family transcriptional regulator
MGVREGLLALLDGQPRYGYQLKTAFEATTGGVWALNIGQVYTTLDRLARDGHVVEVGPGDEAGRRTYTITEAGRSELARWLGASPADAPPPRDELLLKVLLAVGTPSVDSASAHGHRRVPASPPPPHARAGSQRRRPRQPSGRRRACPAFGGRPALA